MYDYYNYTVGQQQGQQPPAAAQAQAQAQVQAQLTRLREQLQQAQNIAAARPARSQVVLESGLYLGGGAVLALVVDWLLNLRMGWELSALVGLLAGYGVNLGVAMYQK